MSNLHAQDVSKDLISELLDFHDAIMEEASRSGVRLTGDLKHCTQVGLYKFADDGWSLAQVGGRLVVYPEGHDPRFEVDQFMVPSRKDPSKMVPSREWKCVPAQMKKDTMRPWMCDRWVGADAYKNYFEENVDATLALYEEVLAGCNEPWVEVFLSFLRSGGIHKADQKQSLKTVVMAVYIVPGDGTKGDYLWNLPGAEEAWERYFAWVTEEFNAKSTRVGIDVATGEEDVELISKWHSRQHSPATCPQAHAALFGVYKDEAFCSYGHKGMEHGSISVENEAKVARVFEMALNAGVRFGKGDEVNVYELVWPNTGKVIEVSFGESVPDEVAHEIDPDIVRKAVRAIVSGDTRPIGVKFTDFTRMAEFGIRSNMGRSSVTFSRRRDFATRTAEHEAFSKMCAMFIGGDTFFSMKSFLSAPNSMSMSKPNMFTGLGMAEADAFSVMDWLYSASSEWVDGVERRVHEAGVPRMLAHALAYRGFRVPEKFATSYLRKTACLVAFYLKEQGYDIGKDCFMEYCSKPTYLLGRVFSCIEWAQYNKGKQRGIRDKMFSSAAAHPKVAAGQLLDMYGSYKYKKLVDEELCEIIGINSGEFAANMPVTSNDDEKLLFYAGYFYERNRLFALSEEQDREWAEKKAKEAEEEEE